MNELTFTAAETGGVRMSSHLEYEDVKNFANELRALAGDEVDVRARLVVWAGPYEVYLAIRPILDTLGPLILGGGGVAGLFTMFARKHPTQHITIHIDKQQIIVIDGAELSQADAKAVNRFFDEHKDDPDETVGGLNTPA